MTTIIDFTIYTRNFNAICFKRNSLFQPSRACNVNYVPIILTNTCHSNLLLLHHHTPNIYFKDVFPTIDREYKTYV